MSYIQTYTGRRFCPLEPRVEDVDIQDIAYALAGEYRFGGHCSPRVTVAEHSVAVSRAVPQEHAMWGLLHDASEAYLRDIPRPVKTDATFADYRYAESLVMWAVAQRFGLQQLLPACVRIADAMACGTEARACMEPGCYTWSVLADPLPGYVVEGWDPRYARDVFLSRFVQLGGEL